MKKLLLPFLMCIIAFSTVHSQTQTLEFLGIPIDGSLNHMISRLEDKGFVTFSPGSNILKGDYDNKEVVIGVSSNRGKVYSIIVFYGYKVSKESAKSTYNYLIRQFDKSKKYEHVDHEEIPIDEDIEKKITHENKKYLTFYYLSPLYGTPYFDKETNELTKEEALQMLQLRSNHVTKIIEDHDSVPRVCVGITHDSPGVYTVFINYQNPQNMSHGEDF